MRASHVRIGEGGYNLLMKRKVVESRKKRRRGLGERADLVPCVTHKRVKKKQNAVVPLIKETKGSGRTQAVKKGLAKEQTSQGTLCS